MPAYDVTFTMVDAYDRTTTKSFTSVSTLLDEATALASAAALAADLAAISELDILYYSVGQRIVFTDAVTAGANVDEGVTFTLRKEDNYKGSIKVPGPENSIFQADGSVILSDANVVAFIANFLTGGDWTFSDGEQATALLKGVLDK